jgi:hypothetical protein
MRSLFVFFVFAASLAYAEEDLGILKIFDQFVVSSAAAGKCTEPDKETLTSFLANFQMVSVFAAQALKKQYPQRTEAQIAEAMERRNKAITEKMSDLVREKRCNDPGIQEAVKRFHVQAKWKPGG